MPSHLAFPLALDEHLIEHHPECVHQPTELYDIAKQGGVERASRRPVGGAMDGSAHPPADRKCLLIERDIDLRAVGPLTSGGTT
jgi:hypothetical protein